MRQSLILILIAVAFVLLTVLIGYSWLLQPPNTSTGLQYPTQNLHNIVQL